MSCTRRPLSLFFLFLQRIVIICIYLSFIRRSSIHMHTLAPTKLVQILSEHFVFHLNSVLLTSIQIISQLVFYILELFNLIYVRNIVLNLAIKAHFSFGLPQLRLSGSFGPCTITLRGCLRYFESTRGIYLLKLKHLGSYCLIILFF
jgi:hypothetical protein